MTITANVRQTGALTIGRGEAVARADGGPLAAGQLAVVGERGRELFIPETDGYVMNARDTARALAGGGHTSTSQGGNIYVTSEEGKGTLIKAGRKKEIVGEFDMKEKTFATFAAADGALYVRTETQLFKFAKR